MGIFRSRKKTSQSFSAARNKTERVRTDDAGTTATPTPSTEEATARSTIDDCVEQSGMFPSARSRAPSPERSVANLIQERRGDSK